MDHTTKVAFCRHFFDEFVIYGLFGAKNVVFIRKVQTLCLSLVFLCSTVVAQNPDARGYIVKLGDKVPNFRLTLADGKEVSLRKLLKKHELVMLQFTASWCGVCRQEMPHIESDIWQPYKDKGLSVIGVDYKESPEKVREFAEKMKISYPLAIDTAGNVFALFAQRDSGVTRNVLINRKGRIVFLTRLFDIAEFEALKKAIAETLH